jgi:hypothetical protein
MRDVAYGHVVPHPRGMLGFVRLVSSRTDFGEVFAMKHVPKQAWMGCAVATAAMLAERTYEEVAAHWPDVSDAQLRSPRDLRALLESVTETDWRLTQCWNPLQPVCKFAFPDWPVAVFIKEPPPRARFAQWIVVRDEIIHDPGKTGADIVSRYHLRDWLVTWIAQPVHPDELIRSQARNRLQTIRDALRSLSFAN